MLRVFVIKGENLVAADVGGKSDPYVKLYSVDHGVLYRFGRTETISSTLNPVWDAKKENPICCPYVRAQKIFFELWDYDVVSKDDSLGECETLITPETVGKELKLKIKNSENKECYLYVQIMTPIIFFPRGVVSKEMHSLYISLLFRPASKPDVILPIRLQMMKLEGGKCVPVKDKIPKMLKFSEEPDHLGPGGFTQVFRFNLARITGNYLPIVSLSEDWEGVVNVTIAGGTKEKKEGKIRRCDSDEKNTLTNVDNNDVAVKKAGQYSSGVVIQMKAGSVPVFKKIGPELIQGSIEDYASRTLKQKFSF
jgi:hypothetical protein